MIGFTEIVCKSKKKKSVKRSLVSDICMRHALHPSSKLVYTIFVPLKGLGQFWLKEMSGFQMYMTSECSFV